MNRSVRCTPNYTISVRCTPNRVIRVLRTPCMRTYVRTLAVPSLAAQRCAGAVLVIWPGAAGRPASQLVTCELCGTHVAQSTPV